MTRVIESIASIYFCVSEPGAWQKVIERLAVVFDSNACALALYDLAKPDGRYLFHHGLAAHAAATFTARFTTGEPWLVQAVRAGQPEQAFLDRVDSPQTSSGERFAIEWLGAQGLQHVSCGIVERTGDEVVCLENFRRAGRPPFDQRHLARYALLLPHLRRAWQLGRLLHTHGISRNGTLLQLVERAPEAHFVADRRRPAPAARGLVARGAAAAASLLWLPDAIRTEDAALRPEVVWVSAGTRTGGAPARPRIELNEPARERRQRLPVAERARWREVIATTPQFEKASAEVRLRLLYTLTRAEARLAVLLARGSSLQAAAKQQGVAINTVRTHLQRIYDKTGAHRQSELVRLLLTGPAGLQEA